MPLPKVQLSVTPNKLTIRINSYVHLFIKGDIVGIKSWIKEGERRDKHYIKFKTKTTTFKTEYEDKALWLKVLSELDKKLIK